MNRSLAAACAWLTVATLVAAPATALDPKVGTEKHRVAGLSEPVEILVDHWGVPHVYAANLYDVFFGQGFNAARDRLWQLDLWKRRGDGSLAEAFGPDYIEKDRAARLFLFRGEMHTEWLAYGSDTKRIVTAFVDGINAYIELCQRDPTRLPPEFELLDYTPVRWTPETVVRIRSHGLLWNAQSELARAEFVRDHGLEALRFLERLEPPHTVQIPEGLNLTTLPDGILDTYDLARSNVTFSPESIAGRTLAQFEGGDASTRTTEVKRGPWGGADRRLGFEGGRRLPTRPTPGPSRRAPAKEAPLAHRGGSNNWAVSPARTRTGRPILANDPHRAVAVPSLRYLAHLSAPGLDVIGAGEPALPGISIGHNDRAAFGLTIFFIDQEDLYVYETHPEQPDAYRYRGRWEPMRLVTEPVAVRGGPPVDATLRFTRHGPVVYTDPARHLAVALRAAWLEPGTAPYLGSIETMRARSWDEFLAAMNRWGLPGENLVYADVDGHIGWKPGGLTPIRQGWDGLLPVPGDGRYEWAGFRDMDALPVESDPARGWIATANQMNLPADYPHAIGFEWIQPYRYQRLREVLDGQAKLDVAGALALQTDTVSVTARRIVRLLDGLASGDPRVQRGLSLLQTWNANVDASSAAAALYEVWFHRHLAKAVVTAWVDDDAIARRVLDEDALYDLFEGSSAEVWIARLEDAAAWQGPDPRAARDQALLASLAGAMAETEQRLGEDPARWRWGDLHVAHLRHPLSAVVDAATRERIDVGPAPRGGSGATVNSTWYGLEDFVQKYGASFRMVLDVGAWDASVAMNSPGQSGDPNAPGYRDLFGSWAKDEAFPLLYSRERVEAATVHRIELVPEGGVD